MLDASSIRFISSPWQSGFVARCTYLLRYIVRDLWLTKEFCRVKFCLPWPTFKLLSARFIKRLKFAEGRKVGEICKNSYINLTFITSLHRGFRLATSAELAVSLHTAITHTRNSCAHACTRPQSIAIFYAVFDAGRIKEILSVIYTYNNFPTNGLRTCNINLICIWYCTRTCSKQYTYYNIIRCSHI